MRKLFCLFSVLFLLSIIAFGQRKDNSSLIYGTGIAFRVTPPAGWAQDSTPRLMHGEHTVFFPMSQKWQTAPVVIFIAVCDHEGKLSEFIDKDLLSYKKTKKNIVIRNGNSIKTYNDGRAEVKEVLGDEYGNYEAIAYIKEEKAVVMVILSTKNEGRYNSNYERFEKVVKSYKIVE